MTAGLSKLSTATIRWLEPFVPWLAAKGPLAYSPAEPPARNYFFQYNWILLGIFEPGINLREHRYFGSCFKEDAGFRTRNNETAWFLAFFGHLAIVSI